MNIKELKVLLRHYDDNVDLYIGGQGDLCEVDPLESIEAFCTEMTENGEVTTALLLGN